VDDHEAMRAVLARALSAAGVARVRATADAAEALALLRERRANLILTDQTLPGMDGLAFIAAVRADAALAGARIVMISGHADAVHAEAARSAGADAVLEKPVSPRALMAAIGVLLAKGD
jgi:two-component system chemotaxis response regulator CheY